MFIAPAILYLSNRGVTFFVFVHGQFSGLFGLSICCVSSPVGDACHLHPNLEFIHDAQLLLPTALSHAEAVALSDTGTILLKSGKAKPKDLVPQLAAMVDKLRGLIGAAWGVVVRRSSLASMSSLVEPVLVLKGTPPARNDRELVSPTLLCLVVRPARCLVIVRDDAGRFVVWLLAEMVPGTPGERACNTLSSALLHLGL